jgi:hypothetical protein
MEPGHFMLKMTLVARVGLNTLKASCGQAAPPQLPRTGSFACPAGNQVERIGWIIGN